MARIRSIKPDFFRHEGLYEAERASGLPLRLAFAGLWTAADREGRFAWRPRVLKLDVLPFDDVDFAAVLDALAAYGFVVKYQAGSDTFGHIPSWSKHQHINQREAVSSIPAPAEPGERTCTHVHAHGEGKGREMEGEGKGRDTHARAPTPGITYGQFERQPEKAGEEGWRTVVDVDPGLFQRWLEHLALSGKPILPHVALEQARWLAMQTDQPAVVDNAIRRGWRSLHAVDKPGSAQSSRRKTFDEIRAELSNAK